MVSIRALITQFYLRHSKYKKIFSGDGGGEAAMARLHKIPAALPSKGFRKKYKVSEEEFLGQAVYTIAPKSPQATQSKIETILYLHGGGYVGAISPFHWLFIGSLVKRLGVTVVVPFYPRAPQNDVDANFAFIMPFYDAVAARYDPKALMVMGDSAGAGLSLALSQQLIAHNKAPPAKITLLSPWLDARGNDPLQASIEKYDCILGVAGLRAAGKAYAGTNSLTDARISPGLASLSQLPPIAMFAGTYDILITDARNFKIRADAHETSVDLSYYEYEKMHHVWMLIPCPETYQCLDQIEAFCNS